MTFRGHTRSSKTDGLIVKPGHVNCIVSGCSPTTIAQSKTILLMRTHHGSMGWTLATNSVKRHQCNPELDK